MAESNQLAELREAPLEISPEEFRALGHRLVEQVAEFLGSLPSRPVTPGESPSEIRAVLGDARLPECGTPANAVLDDAVRLLVEHSLFNGHPRFMGFITSPAAPLGALGELLAAAVNANAGGWILSPMASEIEAQTIRWLAEMIGYPTECAGLLVTGGTMANFVAFLAARRAKLTWDARTHGLAGDGACRMRVYASTETHTWIHKAVDLFGLGLDAIAWIPANDRQQINTSALRAAIDADQARGDLPFMVIWGNAVHCAMIRQPASPGLLPESEGDFQSTFEPLEARTGMAESPIFANLLHRPLRSLISVFAVAIEVIMMLTIIAIMVNLN